MTIIKPSVQLLHATPEQLIAHTSRACYQSFDGANEASDARLISYFRDHDESPMEFAWAVMDITCSYACHVHLLRHRFFAQQWRSQRYDETFEWIAPDVPGDIDDADFGTTYNYVAAEYQYMRQNGAKKQDARYLIPQGVAVQGFMGGSARAWLSFLRLRTSKKAMPETRQVAQQIEAELKKVWPTVMGGNK